MTVDDGIYSRYFTAYTGTGFYGVRVVAENDGNAKILGTAQGSRAPAFINITDDGEIISQPTIGMRLFNILTNPSMNLSGIVRAYRLFQGVAGGGGVSWGTCPPGAPTNIMLNMKQNGRKTCAPTNIKAPSAP